MLKHPYARLGDLLMDAGLPQTGIGVDNSILYSRPLTQAEQTTANQIIAAYNPAPIQESEIVFALPVRAPDFLVSSPTPKIDPLEALTEMIAEWQKPNKSIAAMVANSKVYLEAVEKKIKVKEKVK